MLETEFAVEHRSPNHSGSSPPPDATPAGRRFFYPSGARPLEGYTIKRGIGHGGFGEVYYAVADSGKDVALKLIRRNLEVELRGIAHCLNLKHPNLLAIYNVLQDADENYWVVMEYVAGKSLQDVLAEHPQGLPVPEAMAWFHGLAAGVAHLHKHGIVHRDLKPGNVFCEEGVVKVGDYGLSKFIACSRRSGQTESVGTVHYMAPEIANGRYGKEIDIYALGVILYEILTGRLPFEGETVGEILMKHLTASPDLSALPGEFRPVAARALEKDPDKRFHDVGEMLGLLPGPPGGGYRGPTIAAASGEQSAGRPPHDRTQDAETAYVQAEL
ncbi:MAG: serine/threonine protein kinase, partial [Thermogutta sp.]|nr:serine/threonine protein kinase [Thermogutta sp.]